MTLNPVRAITQPSRRAGNERFVFRESRIPTMAIKTKSVIVLKDGLPGNMVAAVPTGSLITKLSSPTGTLKIKDNKNVAITSISRPAQMVIAS